MLFKENDKIQSYNIEFSNKKIVSEMVLDMLSNGKESTVQYQHEKVFRSTVSFRIEQSANLFIDKIVTRESCDADLDYYDGYLKTNRMVFSAPFSITFASGCVSYEQERNLDDMQQKYLSEVKRTKFGNNLSNLLHDVESRETLYAIIEAFSGDMVMLNMFLKTYHPDLAYFREILPYVELVKNEEFSYEEQKERLKWAEELKAKADDIMLIRNTIESSVANSIIADNLKLDFKKQDLINKGYEYSKKLKI